MSSGNHLRPSQHVWQLQDLQRIFVPMSTVQGAGHAGSTLSAIGHQDAPEEVDDGGPHLLGHVLRPHGHHGGPEDANAHLEQAERHQLHGAVKRDACASKRKDEQVRLVCLSIVRGGRWQLTSAQVRQTAAEQQAP